MSDKNPRVFATKFSALSRWDPSSFHPIGWNWPADQTAPLISALERRKEKVDKSAQPFSELRPITIHFDGSVEHRQVDDGVSYSMDLFWAHPGDVVVSKIDLKNGAVTVIPSDWDKVVLTGHFAVYKPRPSVADPRYLHLLIQTGAVKNHLWRNKVGAEGRKEVKLDFFESLAVPLPSIPDQQAIIAHWHNAREELFDAQAAMKNLVSTLSDELAHATSKLEVALTSKAIAASWKGASQWDINSGRAAFLAAANPHFMRLGDHVEECGDTVRPWESPRHEWPVYGVSNKVGVYLNGIKRGDQFTPGYSYKSIEPDWFFHNPTRANVGSLGIVPSIPTGSITSPEYQVWRLTGALHPQFVDLLIQTEYFLKLVAINRVGGVKQRLFFANLAEIRLPNVSAKRQAEFASERELLVKRKEAATVGLAARKVEIDKIILGEIPVPVQSSI